MTLFMTLFRGLNNWIIIIYKKMSLVNSFTQNTKNLSLSSTTQNVIYVDIQMHNISNQSACIIKGRELRQGTF